MVQNIIIKYLFVTSPILLSKIKPSFNIQSENLQIDNVSAYYFRALCGIQC